MTAHNPIEPPEITALRRRVAARHNFRARVWRIILAALALFWPAVFALVWSLFQ